MASGRTVRQVKHGERLRRSQTSLAPALTSPCPDDLLIPKQLNKEDNTDAEYKPTNANVEVEGYGPYKPAPPPKPLGQPPPPPVPAASGAVTPPPYRMPPYPLYNEPNISMAIPGAAGLDVPVATSSPSNPQNLQTHSSKFPIEREVILSSSDKNSKIPLLHDYMKRSKGAIAPDIPPKQISAWTQQGQQILSPDQNHSGHTHSGQPNEALYRATYHNPQEYYNGPNIATGAIPRSTWECEVPQQRQHPDQEYHANNNTQHTVSVQIENTKETNKDTKNKTMTKTYHTIKDIISSKFKSNKDNEDKNGDEIGLNNMADEIRKSTRNIDKIDEINGELVKRKPAGEQGIYGKPRTDGGITLQQHQYNQHVMQQQMLATHQTIQQFQPNQTTPNKSNQQMYQLTQSRSQEMISARHDEYYPNAYIPSTPHRPQRNNMHPTIPSPYMALPEQGGKMMEDRRVTDLRSPQQIERDSLRQQSFEARRAASQPQLAYDMAGDVKSADIPDNKPQPQIPAQLGNRRGSQGNYVEATKAHDDSDEGGFIKKNMQKELDSIRNEGIHDEGLFGKDESKVSSGLIGHPRKRLEGEIGKIEGVYNVGQRDRNPRKHNAGSAASSDYEKPSGGQSSSAADSGRGSAAYSSGRTIGRHGPPDTPNHDSDNIKTHNGNYRDLSTPQGHDPEWVDIVETELRHILEPGLDELSLQGTGNNIANSTLSESISSMSPPLPPLSPDDQSSHNITPQPHSNRYKHSNQGGGGGGYGGSKDYSNYSKSGSMSGGRWYGGSSQKHRSQKKQDHSAILRSKQMFGLDMADMTSTTTRSLDLESMLDGQSVSDGDMSTADARTIRKQLEGLENMYTDVLKLLGVKNYFGRYQPSDPRISKRRYGSISSLPSSSVSSRPIRDKRRAHEDRKKVRDIRGINKRFQRLESHVVTLARSVAHLSSEMRTQHIMIQEMENIRGEIAALRTQTNMLNVRAQSTARTRPNQSHELPNLANPARVKKLTKFFGDEPPLLRLFLRKLGYEKYANIFENERIGMVELPYLSEERLQKMGVPLGPRLRIMEEAQISVCKDTTLCIV